MSINRNSYWGCCSMLKPGPSLSPTQPLGTPRMATFKLFHLDMDVSTASSVF